MRALVLGDAVVVGAVVVPGAVAVLLAARLALLGLEVAVLAVGVARQLAHRVRGLARPLRVTLALLHTQLGLADVASLGSGYSAPAAVLQCCGSPRSPRPRSTRACCRPAARCRRCSSAPSRRGSWRPRSTRGRDTRAPAPVTAYFTVAREGPY